MKDCPFCGAESALETYLRIDLDDVVLGEPDEYGYRDIVSFVPARSANDPDTGLVVEEAAITCRECGHEVPYGRVQYDLMRHWSYDNARA